MANTYKDGEIELIFACLDKNNAEAWTKFTDKYSALICTAIRNRFKKYGLTPIWEDVDDVKQNVFFYLWNNKKLETLSNPKSLPYWLAIVSGNITVEYLRNKARIEPNNLISISNPESEKEIENTLLYENSITSNETHFKEMSVYINSALRSLSPKERIIIKLHFLYGKTYQKIGDILKVPGGTVSSCVKRAKNKLSENLKYLKKDL